MPYANCKIYSDGSHFIAIPRYPRRNRAKRQTHRGNPAATAQICGEIAPKQIVMKSVFSEKENALIPLTQKQEQELGRKLLLFDDFICWDEGEYLGKVTRDLIRRLCAKQLLARIKKAKVVSCRQNA